MNLRVTDPELMLTVAQAALSLGKLAASGRVDHMKDSLERVAQDVKALAVKDDGSLPTDEEFHQIIVEAKTGFQSAIDDGGPGA